MPLQVIWKRLYKTCSGMDLNGLKFMWRLSCEWASRNVIYGRHTIIDTNFTRHLDAEWCKQNIHSDGCCNTQVVDKHVDLSIQFFREKANPADTVYSYACETLSLGLLYTEFRDVIRKGDGNHVLRVWKFLLLLFKASNNALTLLVQYHLILPPRLAEQQQGKISESGTIFQLSVEDIPRDQRKRN